MSTSGLSSSNSVLVSRYVRCVSTLSYETFKSSAALTAPSKTLVCLHGILGSKKNWRTPSNIFTKKFPQFYAVSMDHRGHGASPKTLPGENTVEACAHDVLKTLKNGGLPEVFKGSVPAQFWGHSYSGKVVLHILDILIKQGSALPEHVWILDSMPGNYDRALDASHQQSVSGIINTIMDLPAEFESKEWVESHLASKGIPKSVIDWLSLNLAPVVNADGSVKSPKAFHYTFDIRVVRQLFDSFCDTNMWQFLESYQGSATIHFIRAGKNRAWTKESLDQFAALGAKNDKIKLHTMPHVGHWLHAEDVHGMIDIIATHSGLKAH
jgi:pimeloyl-ACP methyl ester carboxylesterase